MRDLAPDIYRQRLVIEGIYTSYDGPEALEKYMTELSQRLNMRIVYGPIVKNLSGGYDPAHRGHECVMIWTESGAQIYTWERNHFFTVDIYTCKKFSVETAVSFTKDFFKASDIEFKEV